MNTNSKTEYISNDIFKSYEPLVISVKEACHLLGIGNTTLYALIKSKNLSVVRIGRRTLVTVASIKSLIETSNVIINGSETKVNNR